MRIKSIEIKAAFCKQLHKEKTPQNHRSLKNFSDKEKEGIFRKVYFQRSNDDNQHNSGKMPGVNEICPVWLKFPHVEGLCNIIW